MKLAASDNVEPKRRGVWRDFLVDIAVVVIGVLLALGAGQIADVFHWRDEVAEGRKIIASELAFDLTEAFEVMRAERCTERRLDALASILDAASRDGKLPPVGDIGWPPERVWLNASWSSLVASQTATHLDDEELANLGYIYGFVQRADVMNERELRAWTDLNAMVGPGRRLDPVSENALRQALSQARYLNREVALIGERIADAVDDEHLPFSADDLKTIAESRHKPLRDFAICRPIGASPPSSYGQAPFADTPPEIDKTLQRLGLSGLR